MEPVGDHTGTQDQALTTKVIVLLPPPRWFSPTCQETQLIMPGSSASTGGLSDVKEVHYLDSDILLLDISNISNIFEAL